MISLSQLPANLLEIKRSESHLSIITKYDRKVENRAIQFNNEPVKNL